MSQTKKLDRDEGKGGASQANPVAILHFPVGQVLNAPIRVWVHIGQREISGSFLYVTMSSIQAFAGSGPAQ